MSDMAKQARAAMKAKANRLGNDRPTEKVDSSSWTPPEMLNADAKTGMRPISRRAYKSGGKVQGSKGPANMGRAPRSGNKPLTADSFVNKDLKEANEEREGVKHIGGLKKGGRAKKFDGGSIDPAVLKAAMGSSPLPASVLNSQNMMDRAKATSGVPVSPLASQSRPGANRMRQLGGFKKGGSTEKHDDVAADKALIKKMVKPSARTARKTGGGVFDGPSYPGKVPGVVPGGRSPHATGGKVGRGKGKTNINIVIAGGKPAGAGDMMGNPMGGPTKPPGADGMPGGMPIPVPPPPGGAPMPMPMPIPMPGPVGPAGPPGMPMPRKSGGRAYRSYEDMDAGAGSGKGRLEKTEIATKKSGIQKVGK